MSQIDIVFINPGNRMEIYQELGNEFSAIEPPVWAGLMATYTRLKGLNVRIIDAEAESLTPSQVAERVQELDPVLVAVVVYGQQPSASTQNMFASGKTCSAIKELESDRKILILGGHVAALPEATLREEDVDFTCGGEALVTLVELAQALKTANPDFSQVHDLRYWDGKEIKVGPPAALVKELETEMPGMAWDLLPMDKYRAHNWHCLGHLNRQPYVAIYTSLGCPFHCSFCCIQAPFKSGEKAIGMKEKINSYRFWSPKQIVDQMQKLSEEYGVKNIKIADEMFVLNPRHILGICDEIIERDLEFNFWAYARVDTVKDNMLEKLKAAGFNWLAFGIEAAHDRVRDDVQKGFGQDLIAKTISKVRDSGINVIGNYIFGLPEDDHETMQATLDMAMELNCEFANFYSAMAYPGSRLYTSAVEENLTLPQTWNGFSQHAYDTLPLSTKHISAAEVLRFRDNAFHTYFENPKYLQMIQEKFGNETVEHIKKMTKHRLKRKILEEAAA